MKMPQLLILLLTIWVHAAAGFPADRRVLPGGREKHASWDDVNVVAHGLLQLGQGLKEHVDKTKAQMRDVSAKLKAFNITMASLERKQQEQEEALRARGKEVEEREKMAAEMAEEMRVKVEEVKKQAKDIYSRMDRLEGKVEEVIAEPILDSNYSDHTGIPFIQKMVAAQNKRIDQLVDKIRQQQDKLEKQSLHLQALQSKVSQKRVKSHRRRDEETALRGEAKQSHIKSEGGWTVIQKRLDGFQSFNQRWESYKSGFGSLNGEFWLGLENVHSLTNQGQYILQAELSDWVGHTQVTHYQVQLDGEEKKFALHLEQDSSSGVQEELIHTGASGIPFSTADRDNDFTVDVNCAELHSGGWWFSDCGTSNLNGKYPRRPSLQLRRQGMFWTTKGQNVSLKTTLLKIAPSTIKQ
ncbi:angiopoietin-related protein 4-like isoform 3-T3 [Aulostomus maculatus]